MKTENKFRVLFPPIVLAFIVIFMVMYSINTSSNLIVDTARFAVVQNARGSAANISASLKAGLINDNDSLVPVISSTFFEEELHGFVCDSDGKIIASTTDTKKGTHILDYLASEGVSEKWTKVFEKNMSDPDTVVFSYRSSGGNAIASAVPVGAEGWTALYILPAESLKNAVHRFRKDDRTVISTIVISFAVYILMLVYSARKTNIRMQHENLKLTLENRKEKERVSARDNTVKILAEEYSALYYTELFSNRTEVYSMDEFARSTYGAPFIKENKNFFNVIRENYIDQYVHPDDVNVLRKLCTEENVYNELKGRKSYSLYFRVKRGTEEYHNYKLHMLKIGEISSEPESLLIGFINRDQQVQLEQELKEAEEREARLNEDMCTDILTGLYNRRAYELDLEKYRNECPGENFVYAALDVNGLKTINDNMGHEAGDELIKGAAECMKEAFGKQGKIYRTGGDEFVAMFFADEEKLAILKTSFDSIVSSWSGEIVKELAISAGYVMISEISDSSVTEMAKLADQRMYKAKSGYYTRKGIDRRGNEDAFRAISNTYTKIIKVVLNNDVCSVIRIEDSEKDSVRNSISEWVSDFTASGNLHEDDMDKFIKIIDIENMREHFRNSSDALSIRYRRLSDGQYRNALMEIVPSRNYTEEMQLVYIYVKITD